MKFQLKQIFSTGPLVIIMIVFCGLGGYFINSTSADSTASTAEFYVSTTGSDTNNLICSYAQPCATVLHVFSLKALTGGSTINMMAGSYPRQSNFYNGNHQLGASWSSNVTIEPLPGASVTLAGMDLVAQHTTLENVTSTGSVGIHGNYDGIDHVDVDGGAGACASIPESEFVTAAIIAQYNCPDGSGGVGIGANSNVFVTNSFIHNSIDRDGIDVGDGSETSSNITITGNREQDLRTGPKGNHEDCLQFYGGQSNITISNNYFNGCSNSELFLTASWGSITNVNMNNNTLVPCYAPANGGKSGTGGCGYYAVYTDIQNFNCPMVSGVRQKCDSESGISMTHNTIVGDTAIGGDKVGNFSYNVLTGTYGYNNCGGAWESNNLVGVAPQKQYCHTGLLGANDITATPIFDSPDQSNYTLEPNSPGVGRGAVCPSVSITTCPMTAGLITTTSTPPRGGIGGGVHISPINSTPSVQTVSGTYTVSTPGTTITEVDGKSAATAASNGSINTTKLSNGVHILSTQSAGGEKRIAINVSNHSSVLGLSNASDHQIVKTLSYLFIALGLIILLVVFRRTLRKNLISKFFSHDPTSAAQMSQSAKPTTTKDETVDDGDKIPRS